MAALLEPPLVLPPRTLADVLRDLGDVDAGRIRWHPLPGTAKIQDAIQINEERVKAFVELVDGVLVEKVMGFPESLLASYIAHVLQLFVDPRNLGIVTVADGMMQLFPGLLRIPDVAYLSWDTIGGKVPTEAAPTVAPDLAVEIISAGNTAKEMERKCSEYFKYGAKAVWMVYPRTRTVVVYSNPDERLALTESDVLSGGTLLPSFSLEVRTLFGQLDRTKDGLPK